MSCTNCGNLGSNCSCSDNCPTKTSDITVFDCNTFNVLEVPCDATLCDVLGLLESYTTNMVAELSTMTSVVIGANCIGLAAGTYGIQQVIDAILVQLCDIPSCPLHVGITNTVINTLTANPSGGVAPYTYQWLIADNDGDISFTSGTTGVSVTMDSTPGTNIFGLVKCIVIDSDGCLASDVFLWKNPKIPI
jgi:hypothetical protein